MDARVLGTPGGGKDDKAGDNPALHHHGVKVGGRRAREEKRCTESIDSTRTSESGWPISSFASRAKGGGAFNQGDIKLSAPAVGAVVGGGGGQCGCVGCAWVPGGKVACNTVCTSSGVSDGGEHIREALLTDVRFQIAQQLRLTGDC
jgi:hypothetical protein